MAKGQKTKLGIHFRRKIGRARSIADICSFRDQRSGSGGVRDNSDWNYKSGRIASVSEIRKMLPDCTLPRVHPSPAIEATKSGIKVTSSLAEEAADSRNGPSIIFLCCTGLTVKMEPFRVCWKSPDFPISVVECWLPRSGWIRM